MKHNKEEEQKIQKAKKLIAQQKFKDAREMTAQQMLSADNDYD